MHTIIINDKKYVAEEGAPLKAILTEAGFAFPCGGNGKCGKCRIFCPELDPSEPDERFLTKEQIAEGWRTACDKKVVKSLSFKCETGKKRQNIKLKNCGIAVSISDSAVEIAIAGDETVEKVCLNNPLAEYGDTLAEVYKRNPAAPTSALRGIIAKESIELFEAYGAAKAETTAIAGKAVYLKILAGIGLDEEEKRVEELAEREVFDLPTESLYLLPYVGEFIGGDVLAECVKLKEKSLVIDCERTVSMVHIGEEDNIAISLWGCDYSPMALRGIRAAAKLLIAERALPKIYLYGKNSYEVEDVLDDLGLEIEHREKDVENVVSALLSFRTRAKLLREKERTTVLKPYDYEVFQRYLTEDF